MNPSSSWQEIAERLSESGWSWTHVKLKNRTLPALHVADARNDDGEHHAVIAKSVGPAFVALKESIQSVS